jgi:hypothetical protein
MTNIEMPVTANSTFAIGRVSCSVIIFVSKGKQLSKWTFVMQNHPSTSRKTFHETARTDDPNKMNLETNNSLVETRKLTNRNRKFKKNAE